MHVCHSDLAARQGIGIVGLVVVCVLGAAMHQTRMGPASLVTGSFDVCCCTIWCILVIRPELLQLAVQPGVAATSGPVSLVAAIGLLVDLVWFCWWLSCHAMWWDQSVYQLQLA